MKKNIFKILLTSISIIIIYLVLDLLNLPTKTGINALNINWNIASIVVSNIVVIAIFLVTYNLLNKRDIEKNKNQREIALVTLDESYDICLEMIELISYKDIREKTAKNCDFNRLEFQDDVMLQYLNLPFDSHADIVDFSKSGIITSHEYKTYLNIRKEYKTIIRVSITFFDHPEYIDFSKKDKLIIEINKIKQTINNELGHKEIIN